MREGNLILLRPPLDSELYFLSNLRNNLKLPTQLMVRPRANHYQKVTFVK